MMSLNESAREQTIKRGKLNLVDLAGSERQAKTGILLQLLAQIIDEILILLMNFSNDSQSIYHHKFLNHDASIAHTTNLLN